MQVSAQPFRVVGLQPAELVPPPVVGLLRHLQFPADAGDILTLAQQPISLGELRTTCSGVCRFLVVIVDQAFLPNIVGGKTLTRPGPTSRGHVTRVRKPAEHASSATSTSACEPFMECHTSAHLVSFPGRGVFSVSPRVGRCASWPRGVPMQD
jgi:hypothetical protein